MKVYLSSKISLGFLISMLIIFSLGVASFIYIQKMINASRLSAQAEQIRFQAENIRSLFSEVENLETKYIVSGDEAFLQLYTRFHKDLLAKIREMNGLAVNRPYQRERINKLYEIGNERIPSPSEMTVNSARDSGNVILANSFFNEVKSIIEEIQHEEDLVHKELQASVTQQFYQFVFTFSGLIVAGLVILLTLTYVLNTNLRARTGAEKKLKEALADVHDLYDNAPCGYFSADNEGMLIKINETLLQWLGYEKVEIIHKVLVTDLLIGFSGEMNHENFLSELSSKGFIHDIECNIVLKNGISASVIINATAVKNKWGNLVSTRYSVFDNTARKNAEEKTMMLNRELEAFTYSVSHDLRAPLRSINGYSQILVEDYSAKLDEEGNRVIGTIIKNSNRMGQLIDDLLNFSHANRKAITKSNIEMNEFLQPILKELVEQERSRDIRLNVQPLLPCFADINMIRQVWINLLSNALKYTRKKPTSKIDVGSIHENGETIYFVKDNGVGFNMQYYDKLFGVFQRLHKMEDFDGTGVGLALVKRIIERHDGRIWAEAKLNEGAVFYFSIPNVGDVQS